MPQPVVRRLRPYLFHNFKRSLGAGVRRYSVPRKNVSQYRGVQAAWIQDPVRRDTHDYQMRLKHLEMYKPRDEWYPRLSRETPAQKIRIPEFIKKYHSLENGESNSSTTVTIFGRVQSVRTAGSKLVFLDIAEGPDSLQAMVQLKALLDTPESLGEMKRFVKIARKGDWFTVTGHPHRTTAGELSVLATTLPTIMSPSLQQIPLTLEDASTRAHARHVDMLVNPSAIQTLRARSAIERALQDFFHAREFVKVNTPILQAGAGGAVARPFETVATELSNEILNLRIAPELWLKRLVVGGLPRVYEIGPVFRNEGVDATHNPEFTICEFYAAGVSLDDLMTWTETMIASIAATLKVTPHLPPLPELDLATPFRRLEFIPALEKEMGHRLPDMESPTTAMDFVNLFFALDIPVPAVPTLPRMLDALSSHYLEPLSTTPTFITNHPAPLSPLSKTYACPATGHQISARAEFFMAGKEIANMYEEENSPFEQRRKFEEQLEYRRADGEGDGRREVDEGYLGALEWGLPPTGGWGCGIERLVGVLLGGKRVGEVLAFGGLRGVVGQGKSDRSKRKSAEWTGKLAPR